MNNVLTVIGGIFTFIFLALIAVFIFTAPSWYIWNHIVAPKFDAPLFSFWEAFFTILMIRFMFPNISSKTEKK